MSLVLFILATTLWILTLGISFSDEPRPMGLTLGESTVKEVVDALKKRGVKEVFEDKAYAVVIDTEQGSMVGFVPGISSESVHPSRLIKLPDLASVTAYNIPNLGKGSFFFSFFTEGKLFYMKYLVPLRRENRDVILKILFTLRKKYEFKNLGDEGEQLSKSVEKGIKDSFGIENFGFSGMLVATQGNVVIMISVVELDNQKFLGLEYANTPMFQRVSNLAREVYRKTTSFESLF